MNWNFLAMRFPRHFPGLLWTLRGLMAEEKYGSRVNLERGHTKNSRMTYGRKSEEYIAEFCLMSRRSWTMATTISFSALPGEFELENCCRRLKIDKGTFFHAAYRIEQKLGRIFRETGHTAYFHWMNTSVDATL